MNVPDQSPISLELAVIIVADAQGKRLRAQALARRYRETEGDPVFRGRMSQRIFLLELRGAGRVHLVCGDARYAARRGDFEPQDRQEPIRGQRTDEEARVAVTVVDQLAPDGSCHSASYLPEVVDLHRGPIFTETVGEDAVRCGIPPEARDFRG